MKQQRGQRRRRLARPFSAVVAITVVLAAGFGLAVRAAPAAAVPASLHRSLVEIVVTSDPPDPWVPWRRTGPIVVSGSGVIVAGHRILTAAHIIASSVMIEVARSDVGVRYTAEVEHACHVCDLALLRVSDPSFFDGSVALPVGELPRLQQRVQVHGFPIGGNGVSVTAGIVSRVAVAYYAHSGSRLLLAQVDAAVNPGNSGGPAISNGKIAGIAMQMLDDAENIAYIIPAPIIRHFLKDVEDGRVDGFPELDIFVQPLGNPSLRKKLGLTNGASGVLVTAVAPNGSANGTLEPGDVLLAIGGTSVGADDAFELSDGIRVDATALEHRAQVGDRVALRYLRDGELREASVVMKESSSLIPLVDYDRGFPYRVYAGLVFQTLTARHLAGFDDPPSHLEEYLVNPVRGGYRSLVPGRSAAGRSEVVILASVLRSDLGRGYEDLEQQVIHAVDGTPVRSLRHLSELIDAAQGKFVTFTTEMGDLIAIDRALAAREGPKILERYQVGSDRSPDLAPIGAR